MNGHNDAGEDAANIALVPVTYKNGGAFHPDHCWPPQASYAVFVDGKRIWHVHKVNTDEQWVEEVGRDQNGHINHGAKPVRHVGRVELLVEVVLPWEMTVATTSGAPQ